jgi:hypothetical protein
MKLGALLKWGHFNESRSILMNEEVWWKVAQEVISIKVKNFINGSGKRNKFLRKFNRITKIFYNCSIIQHWKSSRG